MDLNTAEAIVLHGANGVGVDAHAHFPHAFALGALAAVAAGAAVLLTRFHVKGWRRILSCLLAFASLPGAFAVLVTRADAPMKRPALAAKVSGTLSELSAQVSWPRTPVRVTHEDDDVLFPLGRYVVPSRAAAEGDGPDVELRGTSLSATCVEDTAARRVVCGERP